MAVYIYSTNSKSGTENKHNIRALLHNLVVYREPTVNRQDRIVSSLKVHTHPYQVLIIPPAFVLQ